MPAARKRKTPNMKGMTPKQMRRKKPINLDHLKTIEPLTQNQEKVFEAYAEGKNLVLHGAAGRWCFTVVLQGGADQGSPPTVAGAPGVIEPWQCAAHVAAVGATLHDRLLCYERL